MYSGYRLEIGEFRDSKEITVRTIYIIIGFLSMAVLFFVAISMLVEGDSTLLQAVFLIVAGIGVALVGLYLTIKSQIARAVRVGPNQFADIYQLGLEAAFRLHIPMPAIYVLQSPILNAFTMGMGKNHAVVLHSAMIDTMSPKELQYVIGHEMGHIKGKHVIYFFLTTAILTQGILAVLLRNFQFIFGFALNFLSRRQEFTADRAGLIACGNSYDAVTALTKLTVGKEMFERMNIREFFRQMDEATNSTISTLAELSSTHPFPVNRIRDLIRFYRSPAYQMIKNRLGEGGTTTLQAPVQGTIQLLNHIADKYQGGEKPKEGLPYGSVQPYPQQSQFRPQPQPQLQTQPQPQPQPKFQPQPRLQSQLYSQPQARSVQQSPAPVQPAVAQGGAAKEWHFCKKCGGRMKSTAVYCFQCGSRL